MKDVKLNGGSHDSLIVNENAQIYALSILKVGFLHLILLQRQLSHHKIEYTIKNVQSSLLCGTGTHTSFDCEISNGHHVDIPAQEILWFQWAESHGMPRP